jgi:hypothetical protein
MARPLKFMAETPSLIKQILEPSEFFVENSTSANGFVYFTKNTNYGNTKLLTTFKEAKFQQKFELSYLNSGDLIKRWEPNTSELFDIAYNDKNPSKPAKGSDLYFMHPLMTADSSLLITAQLTSLLAKIDANSNLVWLKNDKTYHHTLESDYEGKVFVCSRPFESGKYDILPGDHEVYKDNLLDDHVTIISEDTGTEIFSKSVIEILLENGYEDLLLYKGQVISDLIHLNDIQPALESTEFWEKGDLLISCRNLSAVFLYRPSENKILWLKHGPWYNQHDVDFLGIDKIVVFGNDVIREESVIDPRLTQNSLSFSKKRPHNEIYIYNFKTDSISKPYTALLKKEKVTTITSGRCDILDNGDIFIEETNQGRILVGDSINKKIEYVKRLDDTHISSLFWSRIIN